MSEDSSPTPVAPATDVPAPPPDAENPAIIFARKTYLWLLVITIGFIGAVVVFIL